MEDDYLDEEDENEPCSLWSCVMLKGNCSLFNLDDPRVFYFVVTALAVYVVFLLLILADLKYWWSLDRAQQQIFYYVDAVKCKLRTVHTQQRLMHETRSKSDKYIAGRGSLAPLLQGACGASGGGVAAGGGEGGGGEHVDVECDGRYSVATVTERERSRQLWTPLDEDPYLQLGSDTLST